MIFNKKYKNHITKALLILKEEKITYQISNFSLIIILTIRN